MRDNKKLNAEGPVAGFIEVFSGSSVDADEKYIIEGPDGRLEMPMMSASFMAGEPRKEERLALLKRFPASEGWRIIMERKEIKRSVSFLEVNKAKGN